MNGIKFVVLLIVPSIALKCYQCESFSSETRPVCTSTYWRHLNKSSRRSLETHCPKRRSSFCVRVVNYLPRNTSKYVRGCMDKKSAGGADFNVGCIIDEKRSLCMCDSDLCNLSVIVMKSYVLYALVMVLTLRMIFYS